MAELMAALGPFRFGVGTAAPQSLRRAAEYRWPAQERFGRASARQYTGPGGETLELEGVLYPHHAGGLGQVEAMRTLAGKGEPLRLTDGRGKAWGRWCIERVEETQTVFFADGTPRKIEFRLALARYGEDAK